MISLNNDILHLMQPFLVKTEFTHLCRTSFAGYIMNDKNLAPLSISIFFWFKTDYFKFKYYSDDVFRVERLFLLQIRMPGNS